MLGYYSDIMNEIFSRTICRTIFEKIERIWTFRERQSERESERKRKGMEGALGVD